MNYLEYQRIVSLAIMERFTIMHHFVILIYCYPKIEIMTLFAIRVKILNNEKIEE